MRIDNLEYFLDISADAQIRGRGYNKFTGISPLHWQTMYETILIVASLILLVSVLASKISDRFGIPALLLFIFLGMLAGSDGIGGIYFDDPALAQFIGMIAWY